jgi:hypothetical protein
VSLLDTYYGYSFVKTEPIDSKEVVYHFVKGQGWVPETPLSLGLLAKARQASKPMNFGWHIDFGGAEAAVWDRLARDAHAGWLQRADETLREDLYPVFVHDEYIVNRQFNANATPATATTPRYYPGSGERAEATPPAESRHARAIREWQEARTRARRGR